MAQIIGRKAEKQEFMQIFESKKSEFVAVYGRRRVGKTFLIKELFKDKMTFCHTGMSPFENGMENMLQDQLMSFHQSLLRYGMEPTTCPKSWIEAFFMLESLLESIDDGGRQVVFIDELPWMDTPRSNFLSALEHFWNGWGASRDNLMLIVCGSATSWIDNNLINNHGGLYGRLTHEIKLSPFTLSECEAYFKANDINLTRYDIIQAYMAIGGIPYYLSHFHKGWSLAQNIDNLFFAKNAKLRNEFDRLMGSLFSNPAHHKQIVSLLATRHKGFTREEIITHTNIAKGGGLSKTLAALETSDFIVRYVPFGCSKRKEHYKLIDPFCLFYSKFIAKGEITDQHYWENNQNGQQLASWRGIAFEEVCFNHIEQIKDSLGIKSVTTTESAWSMSGNEDNDGTQIDLLINRSDHIVNLCEMKFYKDEFTIDKAYDAKLRHRVQMLIEKMPRNRTIHLTMITTYGLVHNAYWNNVQSELTVDDLF